MRSPRKLSSVPASIPDNLTSNSPEKPQSSGVLVSADRGSKVAEGERLTALLPTVPNTLWPPWCMDYLRALLGDDVYTLGGAARIVDRHPSTIWEALQRYKDFAQAVERIKAYRDWWILERLERGTLKRAIECDPGDRQSAWLAVQHIKARDARYREHGVPQGPGVINITFGAAIGGQQGQTMTIDLASGREVKEAEFEEVTSKVPK